MRLRACLGAILLGLGGCAHLPAYLMVDVDGSTVAFKKKLPPVEDGAAPAPDTVDVKPLPKAAADDEPAR